MKRFSLKSCLKLNSKLKVQIVFFNNAVLLYIYMMLEKNLSFKNLFGFFFIIFCINEFIFFGFECGPKRTFF